MVNFIKTFIICKFEENNIFSVRVAALCIEGLWNQLFLNCLVMNEKVVRARNIMAIKG